MESPFVPPNGSQSNLKSPPDFGLDGTRSDVVPSVLSPPNRNCEQSRPNADESYFLPVPHPSSNETDLAAALIGTLSPFDTPINPLTSLPSAPALVKHAPPSPASDTQNSPPTSLDVPLRVNDDSEICAHTKQVYFYEAPTAVNAFGPQTYFGDIALNGKSHLTKDLRKPAAPDHTAELTPPADSDGPVWLTGSEATGHEQEVTIQDTSVAPATEAQESTTTDAGIAVGEDQVSPDHPDWLERAVSVVVSSINLSQIKKRFKVLSQAFPVPTGDGGHVFNRVLASVWKHVQPHPLVISLTYAVPRKFKMSDLPGSSASTPRDTNSNDYFSSQVIQSAVASREYGNPYDKEDLGTPMAVPSSLNLTIVERFIPPSSPHEVLDTFDPNTNLILTDRLKELSTKNGCLLFVYPTHAGAKTFADAWLGPCLDPLLRSMAVRYHLSADFSTALGTLKAVDAIPDFEGMCHKIKHLCHSLNSSGTNEGGQASSDVAGYTVAYASKENVMVPPKVWGSWWIQQERSRVKREINSYFKELGNLANIREYEELHPSALMQEVIETLKKKVETYHTDAKVEVGVFVLKKNKASIS